MSLRFLGPSSSSLPARNSPCLGRLAPAMLAFKGIGRQRRPPARLVAMKRVPMGIHAVRIQSADAVQEHAPVVLVFLQTGHPRAALLRQTILSERKERRRRTDFDEQMSALLRQRPNTGRELHRLARMAPPVHSIERVA